MRRWMKWTLAGVIAAIGLVIGGIFLYTEVLNDPADELTTRDLSAAVAGAATTVVVESTAGATTPETSAPVPTTAPAATTAPVAADAASAVDGTWSVTTDAEFGYRVEEVLFGVNTTATGRSNQITGSMTIEGTTVTAAEFTVDVATIESDEDRRDNQFRGRIMEVDRFPNATFALTEPIDFGTVPAAGEQVTATATGELTLHGVTRPVTFDVTAEAGDGRVGVLGNLLVVFADYDIDNPSTSGITTEDHGLLEFILVFERE